MRYIDGEFSYAMAAEQYGLPSADTVKEFVRWYRRLEAAEDADLAARRAELGAAAQADSTDAETLPDDPKELKRLLAEARGEAFALRTLVRVIKDDTGIDVLKKPVAKPPKR